MPESSPISIISYSIVGIQGMSGLWGPKRAYIQLGLLFFQTQPCRHTIEQVHRFFLTAHFPPFCERDLFFKKNFGQNAKNTKYGDSNLTIYYFPPRTYEM